MSTPCEHWHCLTLRINGYLHSYCVACGSWGEDTLCGFCQNDWSHGTLEKFLDKRLWYFWRPEAVIRVNIKPIAPDVWRRYHILIIGDAGVPCRVSHKHILSDQACMHVCIMGLDTLTASLYGGGTAQLLPHCGLISRTNLTWYCHASGTGSDFTQQLFSEDFLRKGDFILSGVLFDLQFSQYAWV